MIYKSLLVDDELAARERLRLLLGNHSTVIRIIGEACDGIEALTKIEKMKPDVIFLDIRLPIIDAFSIAERITYNPRIIFVTAYDKYAVKAFDCAALDYLLKPVEPERLSETVERLKNFPITSPLNFSMEKLLENLHQPPLARIQVRIGDEIQFVNIDDVLYFEADDFYCNVFTLNCKHLIRMSLHELEHRLPEDKFIRIHRKYIVNLSKVKKLRGSIDGRARIILNEMSGIEFPVSRSYAPIVRRVLKYC
jgi:DNA-binding LytR/AlgR family response regulator